MNQTPTIEFILPKWAIFATGKIKIRIADFLAVILLFAAGRNFFCPRGLRKSLAGFKFISEIFLKISEKILKNSEKIIFFSEIFEKNTEKLVLCGGLPGISGAGPIERPGAFYIFPVLSGMNAYELIKSFAGSMPAAS